VGPHAEDPDDVLVCDDLIDEPVPDGDPAGARAGKVTHELLERRRAPSGVFGDEDEQRVRLVLQSRGGEPLRILSRRAEVQAVKP
jgi:hypothetical protein